MLLVQQLETVVMHPDEDPKPFFTRVDKLVLVHMIRAVGIEKTEGGVDSPRESTKQGRRRYTGQYGAPSRPSYEPITYSSPPVTPSSSTSGGYPKHPSLVRGTDLKNLSQLPGKCQKYINRETKSQTRNISYLRKYLHQDCTRQSSKMCT